MKQLNTEQFKEELNNQTAMLVKFGAPWCGPCRMANNQLKNIHGIEMFEINIDEESNLAKEYDISSIPVIQIFKKIDNVMTSIYKNVGTLDIPTIQKIIDEI